MSMHFAPQWVKPIKPSGTAVTPTAESPTTAKQTNIAHNIPFPALSSNGTTHTPASTANPGLSYSRATHTPTTPGHPTDSSYFPYTEANGREHGNKPHPFRYSREQILGLWDEDKVRDTPIELVDLGDGGVLVSKIAIRPIGLRELTDQEKKLLSTSVHPPNPTRRQNPASADPALSASQMSRRPVGTPGSKETSTPSRGSAFGAFASPSGAFGTGKIGSIGGGMLSPGAGPGDGQGRTPGALGGGFGGVGRRNFRRTESTDTGPAAPWRTTRTTSGNFEGVLGFGGAPQQQERNVSAGSAADGHAPQQSSWKDKNEEKPEVYGSGGGPGWGTGQKKWRIAAGLTAPEEKLDVPIADERATESVAATAPATPLPERDAQVEDVGTETPPAPQEKEDLGAVEWFYRDPGGQEQGPFTGSQMHEWYSHAYFTDDLPLRRASDSTFQSLADLKSATGNAVQPFLSAVRPRLPPNLPIPHAATQSPAVGSVTEQMRNVGLGNTPQPPTPQQHTSFNQYMSDRPVPSPQQYAPQNAFVNHLASPAGAYLPSQTPWAPQPRMNSFGSVGMPSPINAAQMYGQQSQTLYSPVIGGPVQQREFYSPAPQHPGAPWGAPQPPQQYAPPQPTWQPEPQPSQQYHQQPPTLAPPIDEPSYFPPNEVAQPEPEAEQEHEEASTEAAPAHEPVLVQEEAAPEPASRAQVEEETTEEMPLVGSIPVPAPETQPPVSVWGQKATVPKPDIPSAPASRKSSIAVPAAAATPSKAAPAPASLPAKPVAASIETPEPTAAVEKPVVTAKPAPWAEGRASASGPSLREIQEAEAKEAEARKAARAALASPAANVSTDDLPQNLTWGLPTSQKSAAVAAPPVATPPVAAWGGGDPGPKKTLKQIQEEEEKRKAKAAQTLKAAQAAAGPVSSGPKRGYADLAATSQPPGAGWTTVGAPKTAPAAATPTAARPASIVAKPAVSNAPKPVTPSAVKPKAEESAGPSVEFIRWTKQSLTGLTVNVDEFIQMLLTFPIDPPAADRPGILEVISDSVYANSSTLDGRRFAQEFMTRRKADAARPKGSAGAASKTSLADVVKSVPKKIEDAGFRVVKAKGKKKN